jgi:predicted O-linked N-acetylglucosamine transferase (SPINDLY family)
MTRTAKAAPQARHAADLLLRARAQMERKAWPEARRLLEQAIGPLGQHGQVWLALAEARHYTDDSPGSVEAARQALQREPGNLKACLLAALGLMKLQRHAEAIDLFEAFPQALAADSVVFHTRHGEALRVVGRAKEAVNVLMKALAVKIDDLNAHSELGFAFRALGMHTEAGECFRTVTALNPRSLVGHAYLSHWEQFSCRWSDFEANTRRLLEAVHASADAPTDSMEFSAPFVLVGLPHHPLDMLAAGRLSARFLSQRLQPLPPRPARASHPGGRIRVGYLSSDFHTHATSMLLVEALESRDRERFEVVLFSHGQDDASPLRRRIEQACEKFVDVRTMTAHGTAQCIRQEGIDILVDLKGYTGDNRLAALALRPAPVQVTWLGFPGTTGAGFVDYFIGDPVVTPLEHAPWYSEKLAQMPVCYQPNDRHRVRPDPAPSRAAWGLPADALVLGSFNQPYKITPEVFDTWMDVMRRDERAVLWQLFGGEQARDNLCAEARKRSVDPARLVFAPAVKPDQHLQRIPAADIVLDTWPCNGHTTTSDALWAGVPVVTLQGLTFASRVAGSLLSAVGLDELVCRDPAQYAETVLALAADAPRRQALRTTLVAARDASSLFDAPRFARDLEALYLRMWERHRRGLAPEALVAAAPA